MQEQHSRFQRLMIVSDTDKGVETAAEHAVSLEVSYISVVWVLFVTGS